MKEIEEVHENSAHIEELIIQTTDGDRYVFLLLPWYEYPVFSHRHIPRENGRKSMINNLPERIKEHLYNEHGGYCTMKTENQEPDMVESLF